MTYLKTATLAFLFHQLALVTKAGIPLVTAWRLLIGDVERPKQRQAMFRALRAMERGRSPAEAMEQTDLFPPLACAMVRAGEHGGNLDAMFAILGDYYDYTRRQRKMLVQALSYPAFLMVCTLCILIGAVFFILPVFEDMFIQMGRPLPEGTATIMAGVHAIKDNGLVCLVAMLAVIFAFVWMVRNGRGTGALLQICCQARPIRGVVMACMWQRFSRILSMQIQGGIPLLQALYDSAAVVSVASFRKRMRVAGRRLEQGATLSQAVHEGRLGTAFIEMMLVVGETTGNYEGALATIADYYGWQLEQHLQRLEKFLGPAVLIGVGIIIGFVVLCLVLPLLDLTTAI